MGAKPTSERSFQNDDVRQRFYPMWGTKRGIAGIYDKLLHPSHAQTAPAEIRMLGAQAPRKL